MKHWFLAGCILIAPLASGTPLHRAGVFQPVADHTTTITPRHNAKCEAPDQVLCDPGDPGGGKPEVPPEPGGHPDLSNPAQGKTLTATGGDPLIAFARRPLDQFIIPEGGRYLDPLHNGPHYGIDYANPEDYLNGRSTYFHPIGPGYVTARSACLMCFVEGDGQGRVEWKWPQYNFGWGGLVLIETPYNANVSVYVLYAHLDRDFVNLGDYVTPDDVIGAAGTSGYSEEVHLHMEIRFGAPGRFWMADFSRQEILDRWLGTMFANPALLVFPENHAAFVTLLDEWAALQQDPQQIP